MCNIYYFNACCTLTILLGGGAFALYENNVFASKCKITEAFERDFS
jgi:hypothetical protein